MTNNDQTQSKPDPTPADPLGVQVVLTAEAEVIPGPATLAARQAEQPANSDEEQR